jgi:hypothetical protein
VSSEKPKVHYSGNRRHEKGIECQANTSTRKETGFPSYSVHGRGVQPGVFMIGAAHQTSGRILCIDQSLIHSITGRQVNLRYA